MSEPLSVSEALERVLASIEPGSLGSERVKVEAALGRVLAEPAHARWSLPSAPLSIMDGYAVRSADLIAARELEADTLALELSEESSAGHPARATLEPGACVRIATGAVVPEGADAVVPQEDTRHLEVEGRVLIEMSSTALSQVARGRWIRAQGSDVREGELLLEAGSTIAGGEASLLAATGHAELAVRSRPRVAILSSGDELVAVGETPGRGQIVSTNTLLLSAQIREAGGEPLDLARGGAVPDTLAEVRAAIERAREEADLLIGSGGISVGDHDLVLPALEQLDFTLGFRKLALRPGRPTTFGHLPRPDAPPMPVLALPGNPASTLVAFELLARPLLRALLGLPRQRWRRRPRLVELASAAEGERRREHYLRARLDEQGRAHPLSKQLSGALRSIADFDLLVRVPAGRLRVEAGEQLEALVWRD